MTHHNFRLLFSLNLALIVVASLIPSSMPSLWNLDKVGHFAAYASLFTLAQFAFPLIKTRLAIFLLAIGLGIMLEWLQSFVPGRETSALDALANTIGLLFGILLYRVLKSFL